MIILWSLFLYKDLGVKNKLLFPSILLLLQVACIRHSFFSASNDALFVFFLSLMFICIYRGIAAQSKGVKLFAIAGFLMAAALSVRELLVFYMPGIAMMITVAFYLKRIHVLGVLSLTVTFTIVLLIIHYPSINENGSLSFLDKNASVGMNWAEGNYYEVLKGRKGNVSWDEVAEYKKIYGEDALPKTYFQGIIKDPSITARNFLKQSYYSQVPFLRQVGMLYVVFMLLACATWGSLMMDEEMRQ